MTGRVFPVDFLVPVLRGLGQIMLQRNAVSGALFVLAIAINSITAAVAALSGSLVGTALARLGRFPTTETGDGLYGFNAALVAIAAVHFYSLSTVMIAAGLFAIVFATLLMRVMQAYSLKPFTFPFVLTVWLMFRVLPPTRGGEAGLVFGGPMVAVGFFQSFGQVMFQANSLTGLVFLAGMLLNSRRCAGFAAVAVVLALIVGTTLDWPADQLAAGIYGYNAVLVAAAIAPVSRRILFPILGILLSIIIMKLMLETGVSPLTFPFVLATWVILASRQLASGSVAEDAR